MEPRKPTPAEKRELITLMVSKFGFDLDVIAKDVEHAGIAVLDRYTTGLPGYSGKVMMVVWDTGPSIFDVYTWQDGVISQEERG